ncbi:hypothetical protein PM082_019317 [Marasmius tenuissimus]|nr:hypothetical protein PM082_019317 [Marasmius tenuissimus]
MSALSRPKLDSHRTSETLSSFSTLCGTLHAHSRFSEKECSGGQHDAKQAGNGPITSDEKGVNQSSTRKNVLELGDADTIPDGGLRAWLVMLGVVCSLFTAFGFLSTWGVFQAFYVAAFLEGSSSTNIAWIGSVQYALIFIPSMVVGRLFDKGYFLSLFISFSITLVLATVLLAECTLYWQVFVCQGIIIGLSCGVIATPVPALLSQWFKERRPLALGISACGSAAGGTVVIRTMLPRIGFQWTMRVIALIILGLTRPSDYLGAYNQTATSTLPPPGGFLLA